MSNIQTLFDAYLEAAVWADEPFGYDGQVFSDNALAEAWGDCQDFLDTFGEEIDALGHYAQAGHDLWLTRNGHGAGFWDREDDVWPKNMRDRMTQYAEMLGECSLYISDDNEIEFE